MASSGTLCDLSQFERIKTYGLKKWNHLTEEQKAFLKKGWGVLTYKWRWQIAVNIPYLAIFIMDKSIPAVHQFDMALLASITSKLPIPDFISKAIGLG